MVIVKRREKSDELALVTMLNEKLDTSYSSLDDFSITQLKNHMKSEWSPSKRKKRELYWESKIAPTKDIVLDLALSNYTNLFPAKQKLFNKMSSPKLGANLSPRTVEGHTHAGHSIFAGHKTTYGNTSLAHIISDDVLKLFLDRDGYPYYGGKVAIKGSYRDLGNMSCKIRSPREHFLEESQGYIDSVVHFLESVLHSRTKKVAIKKFRDRELINSFFPHYITHVNSQALLKGSVFGGNFDNYDDIRQVADSIYDMNLGGGTQLLLDPSIAKRYAIGLDELASGTYQNPLLQALSSQKRLTLFKKLGLLHSHPTVTFDGVKDWNDVLAQGKNMLTEHRLIPMYMRTKKGSGVSDDAACIFVAFHDFDAKNPDRDAYWYDSLQRGSHLMDAVDTLEKASTYFFPEGQDQVISNYISYQWLHKIKNDKNYRRTHHISLGDIEARVAEEGTTNFSLFPKQEIIDLTAASENPIRIFPGRHIHSSIRYFLQSLSLKPRGLDNDGRKKSLDVLSNTYTQEKIYAQRMLENHGAVVRINDEYLTPGKLYSSEIKIGFDRIPASRVFSYFDKRAALIVDPLKRRENFKNRYISKAPSRQNVPKKRIGF